MCHYTLSDYVPMNAAAAAAAVGATEQPVNPTQVPLAVINAAVRHVRRGHLSLPFRFTTKAMASMRYDVKGVTAIRGPARRKGFGGSGGALSGETTTTEQEADYVAQMMFNHLRRAGQPFVTPAAVADFVDADKVGRLGHSWLRFRRFICLLITVNIHYPDLVRITFLTCMPYNS